jgi:two-component system, OmpR family, sensor kinase
MSIRSLRARVTSWYVGLLAVALLVFGVCLYLGFKHYLDETLEDSLEQEAHYIGQTFVSGVEEKGLPWLSGELSESYPPENDERYIRISRLNANDSYEILYQSEDARNLPLANLHPKTPGYLRDSRLRFESGPRNERIVLYSLPYKVASGKQYLIETGAPHGRVEQLLRSLLEILLILTPLVLLGAAIGGYLLMSQPLKPVVDLTLTAERIGIGEMGERLPVVHTGDELERLSLSLNRMISRLEDALAHNRRFSADVSHELRTPLTILRGELEHVIEALEPSPEVVESVGSSLEEIERLAKIVESLLTISHLDSGGAGIEFNRFDLQEMVKTTADQMRLLAEEKHITLHNESSGPVYSIGDESRIKQVLVNLLDNAIKYSREGGHVITSVKTEDTHAVLSVRDDGVGIPADALPHIFERFFRADKARARGAAGAGLGLSIVQAICRAHGGTVSVTSNEGHGTTIEVRLPGADLSYPPMAQIQQVATR